MLPPILYKLYKHSISDYSKAPRGLSVLSRVMRIFTHSIISPGLSLRQCSSRCIFRAGRNLPDKEFRYLRTVIVTAAGCRKVKEGSEGFTPTLLTEAPVNGGRNYNGPKVAKFLVGQVPTCANGVTN